MKTNKVVKRISLAKVDWITPSPDSLWVSSESGRVFRVNPATGAVTARVDVGANPLGSAWINGELWVPNIDDGTISIVDPAKNEVRTTLDGRQGPALDRVGGRRRLDLGLGRGPDLEGARPFNNARN